MARTEYVNNWFDPQNQESGRTVWHKEEDAKINADNLRSKYGYIVDTISRPEKIYVLPDGRMSNEL